MFIDAKKKEKFKFKLKKLLINKINLSHKTLVLNKFIFLARISIKKI